MKIGFLFPGQASQKIGMGLDLYQNSELGKKYFEQANSILGYDIQDIIFNGPEERLKQTKHTQPAIFIVSVILGIILINKGIRPSCASGHSLGEYSALTISGAMTFESGLDLVNIRAKSMQEAGNIRPGTMAAIIGLEDQRVIDICKDCQSHGIVIAANFNTQGQVVISGEISAVHAAMEHAKNQGARQTIELNVSGAFHSALMSSAREILAEKLKSIDIQNGNIPVYSNVNAKPVIKSADIRNNLINQLDNPVYWSQSILNMIQDGVDQFIEVGPGRILQGLNRRIHRKTGISGVESLAQIETLNYV